MKHSSYSDNDIQLPTDSGVNENKPSVHLYLKRAMQL